MKCLNAQQAFLGLPEKQAVSYADAGAIVIPFGLEKTVSYCGGTAKGPSAIIEASHEVELFDEEFYMEPYRDIKIATLAFPDIKTDISDALSQLEGIVTQVINDGKFPLTLGGEHTITAGAIRPFARRYDNLTILHFDAHADLRDGYEGEYYSHAGALRRCLDDPAVYKSGHHIGLVSCGIRNISSEEVLFLEDNRHRIHMNFAIDKANWVLEEIISSLRGRPVYLTFDVDGFDSSLMSATGTPEPGGLMWDEVLNIIRAATNVCNVVGADINELAPTPGLHACDYLTAKLAYKILSYSLVKRDD